MRTRHQTTTGKNAKGEEVETAGNLLQEICATQRKTGARAQLYFNIRKSPNAYFVQW
jgi:hypothetical protein